MASSHQSSSNYVYPTHMMDNLSMLRQMIMAWTMRFDEVLDPEKLHNTLTELLQIGDWKKFGGRLKFGNNTNGHLEIHSTTPAVAFWHKKYDISIGEHELTTSFPKATAEPSVHPILSNFWDLVLSPDTPKTLKDFTSRDVPVLSLHIVSFEDATIVSISWPHALFDAKGFHHLVQAWSDVLNGHKENVPEIIGAKDDVLYDIAGKSNYSLQISDIESRTLSGFSFILFVVRFLWTLLTQPTVESRMICLPKKTVEKLHQQALCDIKDVTSDAWVSPNDAILAWFTRTIFKSTSRPISLVTPIDARVRLSQLQNTKGVYAQNMVLASFSTMLPTIFQQPLGIQALTCRQDLLDQLQEPKLLAMLEFSRKRGTAQTPIFAKSNSILLTTNNRMKADIFAAARFGSAAEKSPGPVYHHADLINANAGRIMRNLINVQAKDLDGNYWVSGCFTPKEWERIEKEIVHLA
ncbi:uncharacterized protein FIESC28_03446 [Fusarium coffeatum]|uniref:Uncharacterized protein n=1 Tax=Fusarium coffeatum TaxID=231269 RepID=A0A366S354_9HYPO|nr:uncharacterized protein FIESC28_03446 [Fusarium coffeatum]RBR23741.1 hypothetical protein FIESC28_03446 [Fusarium coffeatum]